MTYAMNLRRIYFDFAYEPHAKGAGPGNLTICFCQLVVFSFTTPDRAGAGRSRRGHVRRRSGAFLSLLSHLWAGRSLGRLSALTPGFSLSGVVDFEADGTRPCAGYASRPCAAPCDPRRGFAVEAEQSWVQNFPTCKIERTGKSARHARWSRRELAVAFLS